MEKQVEKKDIYSTYDYIYSRLKESFLKAFGDGETPGLIPIKKVRGLINSRSLEDEKNNMSKNDLIEVPTDLYGALQDTYTSRNENFASGFIGCANTPEEQFDGITNMALLMYLSNHVAKEYKKIDEGKYKKDIRQHMIWKHIAIENIIASIYVLERTSDEYKNYFSYGKRMDDDYRPTFAIDLPFIGQICVHFGSEENLEWRVDNAQNLVKTILSKKIELGQITKEQAKKIIEDMEKHGVLPEYEGKLYEFVGAMPIEYIGEKIKKYRKIIGDKLPEDMNDEDIKKLRNAGLNTREIYYFFVKMGASKELLKRISKVHKKVTPEKVTPEKVTPEKIQRYINDYEITIGDFNGALVDFCYSSGKGHEENKCTVKG